MLKKQCKDNSKTALLITLVGIYTNSGIIMGYKDGKNAISSRYFSRIDKIYQCPTTITSSKQQEFPCIKNFSYMHSPTALAVV